ncbi:MAG: YbaK/EbsC family protein [bacterium]|nr:YbaK/EbsC family protein [bacterium]
MRVTSPKKFFEHLTMLNITHEPLAHRIVFTAHDLAATLHIPRLQVAKALFLKHEKGPFLAVLSASHTLDFKRLAKLLKVKKISIPKEHEMLKLLKIKRSPLMPFGSRYTLPVVLDKSFLKNKKAVFNAGAFNQSVKMAVKDFVKLEKPLVGLFSTLKKVVAPKKKSVLSGKRIIQTLKKVISKKKKK